jgi:hypothetical protein
MLELEHISGGDLLHFIQITKKKYKIKFFFFGQLTSSPEVIIVKSLTT